MSTEKQRQADTFRMNWGGFPLQSIGARSSQPGQVRIERGFIGAHADIGGGFENQDQGLPLVALNWMVEQARTAGIPMLPITDNMVITNPVIHDKSDNQYCLSGPGCSGPRGEDRAVRYAGGATTTQREMIMASGIQHADTLRYISYLPPGWNADGTLTREPRPDYTTGSVNMRGYLEWLRANGYQLGGLTLR